MLTGGYNGAPATVTCFKSAEEDKALKHFQCSKSKAVGPVL